MHTHTCMRTCTHACTHTHHTRTHTHVIISAGGSIMTHLTGWLWYTWQVGILGLYWHGWFSACLRWPGECISAAVACLIFHRLRWTCSACGGSSARDSAASCPTTSHTTTTAAKTGSPSQASNLGAHFVSSRKNVWLDRRKSVQRSVILCVASLVVLLLLKNWWISTSLSSVWWWWWCWCCTHTRTKGHTHAHTHSCRCPCTQTQNKTHTHTNKQKTKQNKTHMHIHMHACTHTRTQAPHTHTHSQIVCTVPPCQRLKPLHWLKDMQFGLILVLRQRLHWAVLAKQMDVTEPWPGLEPELSSGWNTGHGMESF